MDDVTERLEKAMEERRLDLGMKWVDVVRKAGISTRTLERFRSGATIRTADTTRAVERALNWPRGYVEAVLNGEQPDPAPQETLFGPPTQESPPQEPPSREELIEMADSVINQAEELKNLLGRMSEGA